MADRQRTTEYVERVITDLLKINSQLMKGIGNIVVDYKLANDAPIAGKKLLDELRLGEIKVDRWAPPDDDELEDEFG